MGRLSFLSRTKSITQEWQLPIQSFIILVTGHQCWLVESPIESGNKTILVAGGYSVCRFPISSSPAQEVYNSTEIYNFETKSWKPGPSLPAGRTDGKSLTVQNRYLWIGGQMGPGNLSATNSVLEFKPASGWSTTSLTLKAPASIPVVIPYNL